MFYKEKVSEQIKRAEQNAVNHSTKTGYSIMLKKCLKKKRFGAERV
jgi:hypothetical protein